jgi:uncharacterized protein YecA (UPF0149 family)
MTRRQNEFSIETMSKRQVKRGLRVVHGNKELTEKLGRNDPCPCGSGYRFKSCCIGSNRFHRPRLL